MSEKRIGCVVPLEVLGDRPWYAIQFREGDFYGQRWVDDKTKRYSSWRTKREATATLRALVKAGEVESESAESRLAYLNEKCMIAWGKP